MTLKAIEDALIARIVAKLTYLRDCGTFSARDIGKDGLLVIPPAVRVLFARAEGAPADANGITNNFNPRFELYAVASNLRGPAAAKKGDAATKGVYEILDDLRKYIPGHVLTVSGEAALLLYRGEEMDYADTERSVAVMLVEVAAGFVSEPA